MYKQDSSSLAPKKLQSVVKVPKSGVYNKKGSEFTKARLETTIFKKYYDRGDLPIAVSFVGAQRKITWKLEPEFLDYHLYLPIFFEGLREPVEPYKFLAERGCQELIEKGGNKLLPVLPQLILPIKSKNWILNRMSWHKRP